MLYDSAISRHFAKHIDPVRDLVSWQHHMGCFECTLRTDCVWSTIDMNPSGGWLVEILLCSHCAYRLIETLLQMNVAHLTNAMRSQQLYLPLTLITSFNSVIYAHGKNVLQQKWLQSLSFQLSNLRNIMIWRFYFQLIQKVRRMTLFVFSSIFSYVLGVFLISTESSHRRTATEVFAWAIAVEYKKEKNTQP